jgi:hypothetical protein
MKQRIEVKLCFTQNTAVHLEMSRANYRDVVELDNSIDIEKILEFAKDFEFVTFGKIEEPRVAQINIVLRRSCSRIAFDTDGSVGSPNAVVVHVQNRDDVEGFTAVSGGDEAELIIVQKIG